MKLYQQIILLELKLKFCYFPSETDFILLKADLYLWTYLHSVTYILGVVLGKQFIGRYNAKVKAITTLQYVVFQGMWNGRVSKPKNLVGVSCCGYLFLDQYDKKEHKSNIWSGVNLWASPLSRYKEQAYLKICYNGNYILNTIHPLSQHFLNLLYQS